jgi:putative transposase
MPWTKPYHPPRNQRLDAELYIHPYRVYFVTIRACQGRSPFVRPELNAHILNVLRSEHARLRCQVFTYCLMPDHLHYLVSPCEEVVSVLTFTNQYKGKATNESWKVGWRGRLWQPRFYEHIVRDDESLMEIARYILGNPVRKGLVQRPEDWPWSGCMSPLPT